MKTIPTKVEFNEETFGKLTQEFDEMENKLVETEKKFQETSRMFQYFLEQLQTVSKINATQDMLTSCNYRIWIAAGGMSDQPEIKLMYK